MQVEYLEACDGLYDRFASGTSVTREAFAEVMRLTDAKIALTLRAADVDAQLRQLGVV